jgi:hypothetical protein
MRTLLAMVILENSEGFTRSRTLLSAKNLKALSISPNVPNRHNPTSVKSSKILSIPRYFQYIPTPSTFLRVLRSCQLLKCFKQSQTLHDANNIRTSLVVRISFEGAVGPNFLQVSILVFLYFLLGVYYVELWMSPTPLKGRASPSIILPHYARKLV